MPAKLWDSEYTKKVGRLLGKIHKASSEGYRLGFRYKRNMWYDSPYYDFECYDKFLDSSVKMQAKEFLNKIKALPKDPQWFGMIHGDFQPTNLFSDWEDLWAFDFDDCCYGHFMFDIATAAHIFFCNPLNGSDMPVLERVYGKEGIIACLRAGYEENWQLPEEQWKLIGDFVRLRVIEITAILIRSLSLDKDLLATIVECYAGVITSTDDAFESLEAARKESTIRASEEQQKNIKQNFLGE